MRGWRSGVRIPSQVRSSVLSKFARGLIPGTDIQVAPCTRAIPGVTGRGALGVAADAVASGESLTLGPVVMMAVLKELDADEGLHQLVSPTQQG